MIGEIAITATERYKGATRVAFVCGGRALLSHRHLRDAVGAVTRTLSVPIEDLGAAVERAQREAKEAIRHVRALQDGLARYRAAELRQSAEVIGPYRVVVGEAPDFDGAALKGLASAVVSEAGVIAGLAGRGVPTPVVVACGPSVRVGAAAILNAVLAAVGGRGGGTHSLAQGGAGVGAAAFLTELKHRLQVVIARPES